MNRALLPLLLIFCAVACGDPVAAKLAGIWDGGFEGGPKDPGTAMRPEWRYRGFLQIYATQNRFKMHLESSAQLLDVSGQWAKEDRQLHLNIKEIKFDDRGGQMRRAPGVEPIPPEVVREALGRTLVFNLDAEALSLDGLDMTIGPLLGRYQFKKAQANTRFPEQ